MYEFPLTLISVVAVPPGTPIWIVSARCSVAALTENTFSVLLVPTKRTRVLSPDPMICGAV